MLSNTNSLTPSDLSKNEENNNINNKNNTNNNDLNLREVIKIDNIPSTNSLSQSQDSYENLIDDVLNSVSLNDIEKKNFLNTMRLQLINILNNFEQNDITKSEFLITIKIKKFHNDKLNKLLKFTGFNEPDKTRKNFEIEKENSSKVTELIEVIDNVLKKFNK